MEETNLGRFRQGQIRQALGKCKPELCSTRHSEAMVQWQSSIGCVGHSKVDRDIVSPEIPGMPNYLDNNLRGGDRAEYLAQFILSSMGVSVQVPRQEDHGHDFFCALQRQDDRQLTFHSPFTVQTGTIGGKNFVYGAKKKDGQLVHRPMEIDFLRKLQLPFFVGVVDKEQHRLRLYSTSPMWRILYQNEKIGRIEFCPRQALVSDETLVRVSPRSQSLITETET